MFHHLFRIDVGVFHIGFYAFDHFAEIMRRNTRRHADCNSLGSVDQNIGNLDRKNQRFPFRLVKIRSEIHHVFIQIGKIGFLRYFFQPGFRITHRRRAVSFDGTEISVPVHKRHTLFKLLRHDNQCVINRTVAVRMVFSHRISYDTRAFSVRLIEAYAKLMHIIQRPALYRL